MRLRPLDWDLQSEAAGWSWYHLNVSLQEKFHQIDRATSLHFIGIGGVGMSGIARLMLDLGCHVSGSDLRRSPATDRLQAAGADVFIGHRGSYVNGADMIVVSSAVPEDNPEFAVARERSLPVLHRSEVLGYLMARQRGIAVSGTHGKSTTTSMVAWALSAAGLDPSLVIGGEVNDIGGNARLGQGEFLVAEADESDASFLNLAPEIAVITNIEPEHLDHYGCIERLSDAFALFAERAASRGTVIACKDCRNTMQAIASRGVSATTYGLSPEADFSAVDIKLDGFGSRFTLRTRDGQSLSVHLSVPGRHNVINALGAIAACLRAGVLPSAAAEALREFRGVERRFQAIGEVNGVLVIDDFAHHPSEVRATLSAARAGFQRRLVAVFQPHRYTRTQRLADEFGAAFASADVVILTDVYGALEPAIPGVDGRLVYDAVLRNNGHGEVHYCPALADLPALLDELTRPGDMVLTLGAGDISRVGPEFVAAARA